MPIIEIDKSVLEEIEDVIEQRDKIYENHIATTKKLTDGIEKLYEQEIERLREDNEYLNKVNIELSTEKNRLNNIIDELEKLLKEEKIRTRYANDVERFTAYDFALKRLQELKGSDK